MNVPTAFRQPGVIAALASAVLFGAGTPLAKWLLDSISPWTLAGLLYLGSGLGLALYRRLRGATRPRLEKGEMRWLVAAVVCGGGRATCITRTRTSQHLRASIRIGIFMRLSIIRTRITLMRTIDTLTKRAARRARCYSSGGVLPSVKEKRAPSPNTESAHTLPPCRATMRCTVTSPMPVPANTSTL